MPLLDSRPPIEASELRRPRWSSVRMETKQSNQFNRKQFQEFLKITIRVTITLYFGGGGKVLSQKHTNTQKHTEKDIETNKQTIN